MLSRVAAKAAWRSAAAIPTRALHSFAVESTPNENSRKFVLKDGAILDSQYGTGIHYSDASGAIGSPLAARLFKVPNVTSVFLGPDFVSINKDESTGWLELEQTLGCVLEDFVASGEAVVEVPPDVHDAVRYAPEDEEIVELIREIMDNRIRPSVQEDGGDVVFVAFEEGVVHLQLAGSCVGCASSSETLYNGIQSMLKYYVPEVTAIKQVESAVTQAGAAEFQELEERLKARDAHTDR